MMTSNELKLGMDLSERFLAKLMECEAKLKQFAADTVEGMECLSTCDSTVHDEHCPVAHPVEAWRVLRERLDECEQQRDALAGMDHLAEHYRKERDDAETETAELRAIFDLQQTRMSEATKYWQERTGNTEHPDLGDMLHWFIDRLNESEQRRAELELLVDKLAQAVRKEK